MEEPRTKRDVAYYAFRILLFVIIPILFVFDVEYGGLIIIALALAISLFGHMIPDVSWGSKSSGRNGERDGDGGDN